MVRRGSRAIRHTTLSLSLACIVPILQLLPCIILSIFFLNLYSFFFFIKAPLNKVFATLRVVFIILYALFHSCSSAFSRSIKSVAPSA